MLRSCLIAVILILTSVVRLDADIGPHFPIKATELMPLTLRKGVYRVIEGPERYDQVPFVFEPQGERWILTKIGVSQHELHLDQDGNIVIDRELNLRNNLEVKYLSPIILLPAVVERDTVLSGKTRVMIRNAQTEETRYKGMCKWNIRFVGMSSAGQTDNILPVYCFQATRDIRFSLAKITLLVDFEYVRGKGMITTGIEQTIRTLGLFTDKEIWRLEQIIDSSSNSVFE
jgi:hypothetical protein